jgi:hypothetical protein
MPEIRDLSAQLREATAERHAAVESLPFFLALRAEELPVQSAVSYLRGLAIVHAGIESCLNGASGLSRELWRPELERLPELLATLPTAARARRLGRAGVRSGTPSIPCGSSAPRSRGFSPRRKRPSTGSPAWQRLPSPMTRAHCQAA